MKTRHRYDSGLLSLEACIAVPIFIFLMLFLYSLFIVFEARNEMAHTLLATADSLSKDTYSSENLGNTKDSTNLIYDAIKEFKGTGDGSSFTTMDQWQILTDSELDSQLSGSEVNGYSGSAVWDGSIYVSESTGVSHVEDGQPARYAVSTQLGEMIKARFLAYLGNDADRLLKHLHVQNRVSGLDFSGSYISSGKLYLNLKYTLEYEFKVFNFDTLDMEQSCCSKLWK